MCIKPFMIVPKGTPGAISLDEAMEIRLKENGVSNHSALGIQIRSSAIPLFLPYNETTSSCAGDQYGTPKHWPEERIRLHWARRLMKQLEKKGLLWEAEGFGIYLAKPVSPKR